MKKGTQYRDKYGRVMTEEEWAALERLPAPGKAAPKPTKAAAPKKAAAAAAPEEEAAPAEKEEAAPADSPAEG